MVGGVEAVSLEQRVQVAVFALVEGDGGARSDDRFAVGQQLRGTERPEERDETVDVTDLLHGVAQAGDLLAAEPQRR